MNDETKEIVTILVTDIHDMALAYTLAATPERRRAILAAIEIKAVELRAFIRAARDNDAI